MCVWVSEWVSVCKRVSELVSKWLTVCVCEWAIEWVSMWVCVSVQVGVWVNAGLLSVHSHHVPQIWSVHTHQQEWWLQWQPTNSHVEQEDRYHTTTNKCIQLCSTLNHYSISYTCRHHWKPWCHQAGQTLLINYRFTNLDMLQYYHPTHSSSVQARPAYLYGGVQVTAFNLNSEWHDVRKLGKKLKNCLYSATIVTSRDGKRER